MEMRQCKGLAREERITKKSVRVSYGVWNWEKLSVPKIEDREEKSRKEYIEQSGLVQRTWVTEEITLRRGWKAKRVEF